MDSPIRRIVIVGGGSAGWIVAGVLAARYPDRGPEGLEITVVEAPGRPPIGVGEGTWPSMRATLRDIGLSETDFLRACEASFKQGSRFVGWRDGTDGDAYLHPFTLPAVDEAALPDIARATEASPGAFAREVCFQPSLIEAGRAPKAITSAEYAGAANYAYHLDAGRFGELLRAHCTATLGVRHLPAEIVRVEADDRGDVAALYMADGSALAGDLFVDCSGFASLLIGGHYGVPFRSCREVLFVDRAWAVQVPYGRPDAPIPCVTNSIAQSAGWIWDIGLTSRRGVGHVFASGYISDDEALSELQAYVAAQGADPQALSYRKIDIAPGHREAFWRGNCVAVGLSAGFIEPLEASALALVELSARFLADLLPRRRDDLAPTEALFNRAFLAHWARIIEFLKLHYALSRREDAPFWRDNRDPASLPGDLAEKLAVWRRRPPSGHDFPYREELFPAASYQYVAYGMGVSPEPAPWLANAARAAAAAERLAESRALAAKLVRGLPEHRDLLDRIRQYGLQKV